MFISVISLHEFLYVQRMQGIVRKKPCGRESRAGGLAGRGHAGGKAVTGSVGGKAVTGRVAIAWRERKAWRGWARGPDGRGCEG